MSVLRICCFLVDGSFFSNLFFSSAFHFKMFWISVPTPNLIAIMQDPSVGCSSLKVIAMILFFQWKCCFLQSHHEKCIHEMENSIRSWKRTYKNFEILCNSFRPKTGVDKIISPSMKNTRFVFLIVTFSYLKCYIVK